MSIENNKTYFPFRLRVSRRRLIFYLVTLCALFLIYLKFSELQLIGRIFLGANLFWFFGIIICQVLSFYYLVLNYRDILRIKDLYTRVRDLFPVIFVIQFLNQTIPSATIVGQIFFIQHLRKYGLSVIEGIGRAILEVFTMFVAFGLFFVAATIFLGVNGRLLALNMTTYIIYAFIFIAILLIGVFLVFQKKGRGKLSNWLIGFIHRKFEKYDIKNQTHYVSIFIDQMRENLNLGQLGKKKGLLVKAIFWQALILILNILTLFFISFAIGSKIPLTVAFITFMLTKFIALTAFIPGALGIFEGIMIVILISFNIPANNALALTLLFRAFTFWLPMPIGWLVYRHYAHKEGVETIQQTSL